MEQDKLLFYFAVVFLIVAVVIFGVNVVKLAQITGRATDSATINLTVENKTAINFTTNNINWGSGSVDPGADNATLNTAGGANNVTNGNWTGNTAGLVLENIGNRNVSLNLSFGTNADGLLGGTNPVYQYNVTNAEPGSCLNSTGGTDGLNLGSWVNADTTPDVVCGRFLFNDSSDSIRIDIKLVIPSDSKTGTISDTITATALEVS